MALTLTDIIEDVCQKTSIDKLNQSSINNLIRWVNQAQDDVCMAYPWLFLHERTTLTTVVDTEGSSTITVSATLASGTITGTGTSFASTDVGRFIQFESSNDWYKITAVASSTSLTVSPVYALATDTVMDFTIRTVSYDLPDDCQRVFDVRQYRTPVKLVALDTRTFDMLMPLQTDSGNPTSYHIYTYNNPQSLTGQNMSLVLNPIPSAVMLIEVRYIKRPPQLSVGTDISVIPQIYSKILITGTLVHAYQWINSPNTGGQAQQFKEELARMKGQMPQTEDMVHVIRACDDGNDGPTNIPYPSQYGNPSGW